MASWYNTAAASSFLLYEMMEEMMMEKLGELIKDWMVDYKANSVKPSSYDRLISTHELMCRYDISQIGLEELSVSIIQQYLNELVRDGYALSTIKKQFHLISEYIDFANLNGIIPRPYHKGVKLPSESAVRKHRKEVIAYTKDEQKRLRSVLERGDSPIYFTALLMLETGMRIGEVLALTWSDIDWRRKCVRISKTLVKLGAGRKHSYVQNSAKSYSSNRVIPLSSEALRILEHLKETDGYGEIIFHNRHGDHMSYEASRWWIKRACEEADVPYYGQHVFRHTFATNCYDRGCDVKLLSKLLGHADVTITYNVYVHLFGDALEEMRRVIG